MRYPDAHRALAYRAMIDTGLARVQKSLAQLPGSVAPNNISMAVTDIALSWARIADQVLLPAYAAEINAFDGVLAGSTEVERYHSLFVASSKSQSLYTVLQEKYGHLIGRLEQHIHFSSVAICQSIRHFESDHEDLENAFQLSGARLTSISSTTSDSHNEGKRVLRYSFDNGDCLFYKPASLATDVCFNSALDLLEIETELQPGRTEPLDMGTHGWSRRVPFRALHQISDAESYWRRAGVLLAIADMLNFTDGHFENIVASGTTPTVIDNETFFQNIRTDYDVGSEERHSILFSGMIQKLEDAENGRGLMAAFQVHGPARYESLYPHPIRERTPQLAVRMSGITHTAPLNCPVLNGEFAPVVGFRSQFIEGLEAGYRKFQQRRKEILEAPLWDVLAGTRNRQLVRATMYYLLLLRLIEQPGFGAESPFASENILREKLTLDLEVTDPRVIDANTIIDYEISALMAMDIPVFYTSPGSRDLIDGNGRRYKNFFYETANEQMQDRMRNLDDDYVADQIHIANHHLDLGLRSEPVSEAAMAAIRSAGGTI